MKNKMKQNLSEAQVFTPPHITNQMLDLLGEDCLKDHDTFFFEPTCGDGQMLIVIIERIYLALLEKYEGDKIKALSETLFKFYATELDDSLVPIARHKVFNFFAKESAGLDSSEFIGSVIAWKLHESIECRDALKESIQSIHATPAVRALKRINNKNFHKEEV